MGTGAGPGKNLLTLQLRIADYIVKKKGPMAHDALFEKFSTERFNKAFSPNRTGRDVYKRQVSQISGGSRTTVGGYAEEYKNENSAQFETSDNRTLDEVVNWLLRYGHIPSFCTACYREGRTGDRFMTLVKAGQIRNCCLPNALMTLKEYAEDYASPDTYKLAIEMIKKEAQDIPNEKVRAKVYEHLHDIDGGMRDFRF